MKPTEKSGRSAGADDERRVRRLNTVGLSPMELASLLDRLDGPPDRGEGSKRDFHRWPFRQASVPMRVLHAGGVPVTLSVACRNISRGGVSVLHSSYIHPGTKCTLLLPRPGRQGLPVGGHVVRCGHRGGMVHEIGVRFEHPVDLRSLLRPEPFSEWFTLERVRPESLHGAVLCVDGAESDRTVLRHFLRETAVAVREAGTIAEAVEVASRDACDLVIAEYALPDGGCAELIERLRAAGSVAPVLVATAVPSPDARERYAAAPAAGFIAKPLAQDVLLRAVAEFLLAPEVDEQISTVPPGDPAMPLVERFVATLRGYADRLNEAAGKNDGTACLALCARIAEAAPGMGFRPLGDMARAAAASLNRTNSAAESIGPLRALEAACRHARARAA